MTENIEKKIIEVIATDRIYIPISSMDGKLKRKREKLAKAVEIEGDKYIGERVYARIEDDEVSKARGMKDAIAEFAEKYPKHGKVLYGMIEEKRLEKQTSLYFGVNPNCRLTSDDYKDVLLGMGFTEKRTDTLYEELMQVSRNISKKRDEERSILLGKEDVEDE
jgi:hypothetical protein